MDDKSCVDAQAMHGMKGRSIRDKDHGMYVRSILNG